MREFNSSIEVVRFTEILIELRDRRTGLHLTLEDEGQPLLVNGEIAPAVLATLGPIGLFDEMTSEEASKLQLPLRKALRFELREQRLTDFLQFVQEQVPHYQNSLMYDLKRIRTVTDLPLIPELKKHQLRESYEDLLATNANIPDGLAAGKYAFARTSGTSGERLQIISDLELDHVPPQFEEVWDLELDGRVPKTAILTSPVCSATECHLGRSSISERTRFGIVLHLNSAEDLFSAPDDLVRNIRDELEEFQPDFILANPVYLLWFGRAAQRLNLVLPRISLILNSYQYISIRQRRLISEIFQAPVYNTYTATELCGCMLGVECSRGHLHVFEDHSLVEIDDRSVRGGPGVGRILVTTTANRIMPLLRYDLGDLGCLLDDECGCPLSDWQTMELHGRARDALLLDGSMVTTKQVDDVISTVHGYDHYTCRQVSTSSVVFDVIESPDANLSAAEMRDRFRAAFAVQSVEINKVKALRPERSLKFPLTVRDAF